MAMTLLESQGSGLTPERHAALCKSRRNILFSVRTLNKINRRERTLTGRDGNVRLRELSPHPKRQDFYG